MKVSAHELRRAVDLINAVPSGVMLQRVALLFANGDSLYVVGDGIQGYVTARIQLDEPVQGESAGSVDAALLRNWLQLIDEAKIDLSIPSGDKKQVIMRTTRSKTGLYSHYTPNECVTIAQQRLVKPDGQLSAGGIVQTNPGFLNALRHTSAFFRSSNASEERLSVLGTLFCEMRHGEAKISVTDGYRWFEISSPADVLVEGVFGVDIQYIDVMTTLANNFQTSPLSIKVTEKFVYIANSTGDVSIRAPKSANAMPRVNLAEMLSGAKIILEVDTATLISATRRVSLMADEDTTSQKPSKYVTLRLEENQLIISASRLGVSTSEEAIDVTVHEKPSELNEVVFNLNAAFLNHAAKATGSEKLKIRLPDPSLPTALVFGAEETKAMCFVMPMKL